MKETAIITDRIAFEEKLVFYSNGACLLFDAVLHIFLGCFPHLYTSFVRRKIREMVAINF